MLKLLTNQEGASLNITGAGQYTSCLFKEDRLIVNVQASM